MSKNKPKICLISPRGHFVIENDKFAEFINNSNAMSTYMHYWSGFGIALPTIAGLTPRDFDITIIDENKEKINFDNYYEIIGITAMTQQATRAYEIAKVFKDKGSFVVMGGIHATVLPDEAKNYVDTVFVGEAENTWVQFLKDFIEDKQKQFYYQKDYGEVNMETTPTPRFDLIARYKYRVIWIQSTRGCPHDCEFCSVSRIYGLKHKHKNVQQVINEIKEIKKYWKFAQIGFADDNMFVNRKFSKELISHFRNLNFNWFSQTDISIGSDKQFLNSLKNSGSRYFFIGFESTSKEKLSTLNKNEWKAKTFDNYPKYIENIQNEGMGIFGSLILGLDEDDESVFNNTTNFINNNNLMGAQITILTPFPGSRLRERMERENRILHNKWEYYTAWNVVIKHPQLSGEQLEEGLMRIYSEIYNKENFVKRAQYFRRICEKLVVN